MWDRRGNKGKKHYRKEDSMGPTQNPSGREFLRSRFCPFKPPESRSSIDNSRPIPGYRGDPTNICSGSACWLQVVNANFRGEGPIIMVIPGKEEKSIDLKNNWGESKTKNGNGGPITAPSAKIAPTKSWNFSTPKLLISDWKWVRVFLSNCWVPSDPKHSAQARPLPGRWTASWWNPGIS